jgi:hypothetical protein
MPDQQQFPAPKTQLMVSMPGVERDGTQLARRTHIDAQWCRWYQNRPRKMLGYREQVRDVPALVRAMDLFSNDGASYVHLGTGDGISRYAIDNSTGITTGIIDRTPAGFVPDATWNWQFAEMFDTAGGSTQLFALGTPSASSITTSTAYPLYYGDILTTSALTAVPGVTASGGVCAVPNFLLVYGHDGYVQWSVPGNPLDFTGVGSGDSRPVASKIVRGMTLRGQSGPAVILWSLDSVIIGQYDPTIEGFTFTTLTATASVLSSNGIVEHNGIYYWATSSGFSQFSGVVRDMPNDNNRQWFLDNLNFAQRQKVFAFKIPRWNEIWWCFPYGDATECTHAVVYNYLQNIWYDTVLPNGGRTAAYYEYIFAYPLMAGSELNDDTGGYSVWQHEFGFNEVSGPQSTSKAVKSWYKTAEFSFVEPQQPGQLGDDRAISYSIMEPDFDHQGDITFRVYSRANARARETVSDSFSIPDHTTDMQLLNFKWTGRLNSFYIESNTLDGNYITGSPVIHFLPSDGRRED